MGGLFAVKECHLKASETQTKHLEAEIQMLSRLKHDNIVKYYGAMNTPMGFFMYMEYVSGGTLETRINELGKLNVNLARLYAKQIIQALDFMHTNDVVHRDLKPANVLLTVDGRIKVADFGTAYDLHSLRTPYYRRSVEHPHSSRQKSY